jgi:putative transposase
MTLPLRQIIGILKEHDLGAKTADLCRKHGISEATFYNWKSKFGGMDVSEAKRLKQLQDENGNPSRVALLTVVRSVVFRLLIRMRAIDGGR